MADAAHAVRYELVTVTYLREAAAMRLQARSLARFLAPDALERIWVLFNDRCEQAEFAALRSDLTALYGALGDRVCILYVPDVLPGIDGFDGYVAQQVLKLRIAELVRSPFYVVLDAKNFATGAVGGAYFFDGGRPKARFETYRGSYQADIVGCYHDLFGIAAERRNVRLPAMMTPFGFDTAHVRHVVRGIEARLGRNLERCFGDVLAGMGMVSEFCLFCVASEAQGVATADLYAAVDALSVTLWEGAAPGVENLQAAIMHGIACGVHMVGLHWKRRLQIDRAEAAFLNGLLASIGVIEGDDRRMIGFPRSIAPGTGC